MAERIRYPVVRFRVELDPSDELQDLMMNFFREGDTSASRLTFHTTAERIVSRAEYSGGIHYRDAELAVARLKRIKDHLAKEALILTRPATAEPVVGGHKLAFDAKQLHLLFDITEVLSGIPTIGAFEERTKVAIDLARAGLKGPDELASARATLLDALDDPAGKLTLNNPRLVRGILPGYSIPNTYYSPDN